MENDNIDGLLQRLRQHKFSIYFGSPETVEVTLLKCGSNEDELYKMG